MLKRIPCGKHQGRVLRDLPDVSLMAMQGSWNGNAALQRHWFMAEIFLEVNRRGLDVKEARRNPVKQRRKPKPGRGRAVHSSVINEWFEYRDRPVPSSHKDAVKFLLFDLGVFRSGVSPTRQLNRLFEGGDIPPLAAEFVRFAKARDWNYETEEDGGLTAEYLDRTRDI